ncbi:MAG TPA: CPBP family intramembrane metalloprotease, partial [Firmicutes bacterium]|nr:CPBP family intramembrane metalloprotease [Bacillota bacterium]
MLLKKFSKANYLVKLMLLLAAIFILVLAVFLVVNSFPEALGSPPPAYQVKKSYEFESWAFSFHDLNISFPEGGTIVPVYEQEKQKAALVLGRGIYEKQESTEQNKQEPYNNTENIDHPRDPEQAPEAPLLEYPAGIFLMITEQQLEEIKGDMIFIPVEEGKAGITINNIFNRQLGIPVIWADKIPFAFPPSSSAEYYYFIDQQGEPVLPPVFKDANSRVLASGLLYIIFYIIIWLVVLILSLDHCTSGYWKERQDDPPGQWELLAIFLAGAMAFGGEILPGVARLPEPLLSAGYLAAILLLLMLVKTGKISKLDFGVRRDTCNHGYFIAIIASVMLLATILKLPQGNQIQGWKSAGMFLIIFFCLALPREIIWRGYIQTTLGRQFSPTWGLLGTALLAGAIRAGVILCLAPWMFFYPYTYVEIAVLEPGLAAILGFMYLRTENVLSCALLHTLVIFLPQI